MQCHKVYRVTVQCSDVLRKRFGNKDLESFRCVSSILYVITDDPRKIYGKFSPAVLSIEEVGVGYVL